MGSRGKSLRGRTRRGTFFDESTSPAVENAPIGHSRSKEKNPNFLKFLIRSKGGTDFLLETLDSIVDFAGNFWKSNKTYQKITKTVKYTFPAYFLSKELFDSYRDYKRALKDAEQDAYNDKIYNIMHFLGIEKIDSTQGTSLCQDSLALGADVINWVFSSPQTTEFKIKGFYEIEGRKKISNMFSLERGSICVPIEYNGKTFIWEFVFTRFDDDMSVHESTMHYLERDAKKARELRGVIFKEFMNHFDIENNVLIMRRDGYASRPRINVKEKINQYDIEKLAGEILKVLERGLKRGYSIVGIPGVGKSTIIRALEYIKTLRKYPFVYLDGSCLNYESNITETFNNLRNIGEFIGVLEDADSEGFDKKDARLGCFLNEIDSTNRNLKGVLIMTINDTSLVHYTVINRPGRNDEVIMIEPPRTSKEVYEVLKAQYDKRAEEGEYLKGKTFIDFKDIDKSLLEEICQNNYTQADICEITEKALLIDVNISNDSLRKSFENLGKSKKAIKICNFKDLEPNRDDYEEDAPCVKAVEAMGQGEFKANTKCLRPTGVSS